jgi:O-methyltransferase
VKKRNPGSLRIAEFGVGRGGSATLLAWLANHWSGYLFLFDVFSRIPSPTSIDGSEALARYDEILTHESPQYYGNLPNLMELVTTELSEVCQKDRIILFPGKYEDTLDNVRLEYPLDLVHIDCDWYASTKTVLKFLEGNLGSQGILQIDDYYTWHGSQLAVDETSWLRPFAKKKIGNALVIDTGKAFVG